MEDKRAFVSDGKTSRPFSVTQLLPYTPNKRDLELHRLLKGLESLQSQQDIGITDVFFPSDERGKTEECKAVIRKEINGLMELSLIHI